MKAKLYLSSTAVAISMLLCSVGAMNVSANVSTTDAFFAYDDVPVGKDKLIGGFRPLTSKLKITNPPSIPGGSKIRGYDRECGNNMFGYSIESYSSSTVHLYETKVTVHANHYLEFYVSGVSDVASGYCQIEYIW